MSLQDKAIIITGAAQGFGRTIALECARNKAKVIACDLTNCDETVALVQAEGVQAMGLSFDVTDYQACASAVEQAVSQFGTIDGLVNNGGLYGSLTLAPFELVDPDEWDLVMKVNVKGPWHMCKAVAPHMRSAKSGSIVNISSNSVMVGAPLMCHYVASKAALIGMTRNLATELGPDQVRANAVCPGAMDTPGSSKVAGDNLKELVEAHPARIKSFLAPEEVVGTVKFLLSDDSRVTTGQVLTPDGGMT
jgi:NAD(P)-dependent dehydrogenase (short-subunit alcohol dehydrogenase family)